jgi:hypothetical protein
MTASAEVVEGERLPARRVPDFFVVGHGKSGTTALHQTLLHHPQVHMPMKETRFFAPELRSRMAALGPRRVPETLDDYLRLFAATAPGQIAGEASPEYLRSKHAAERIAAVAPEARIVTFFREPASFLRSFHLQSVHNHVETAKSFRRAMELEPARRRGRRIPLLSQSPQTLLYSDHVRYTEQLRRFHRWFPRDRVLVVIYDDFRADNAGTIRRMLEFLGLPDPGEDVVVVETRTMPGIRSQTLHQLGRAVLLARQNPSSTSPVLRAVNAVIPPNMDGAGIRRAWAKATYRAPEPPDEELMRALRRRFRPEVEAFGEYIGRDLVTLWGYDRLD